ncbi:hypothetical protein [Pelosinus sp. sgz500959]|uniref:hypothetical protein n=1 Tax=Pelosinus sp. sgz500959 TaxID=3242472 RepID=UPI00366BEAC9
MSKKIEETNLLDKIESDTVVVEVIDKHTGKRFRRNLPIKYVETDNGIRLFGETLEGNPSQIAFYSDTAITKINNLLGHGPDAPLCNHK